MRLFEAFKSRNGAIPSHLIVYRDGVADGQFEQVLSIELPGTVASNVRAAITILKYFWVNI